MKVKTVVEFKPDERNQLIDALENLRTLAKHTKALDYEICSYFEDADNFGDFLVEIQEAVLNLEYLE